MLDGHVHIEKQPYSLELIENMVRVALNKGIDELNILDHTHKFKEFSFLYSNLKDEDTINWYQKKNPISIKEYLDFIKLVKEQKWPIKLNFGLEVCYFKEHKEKFLDVIKNLPKFDFLIGSIHFVDGIGIDLNKELFTKYDVDTIWKHYFEAEEDLARTRIFSILAHPDEIKLMAPLPSFNLLPYYEHLALTLVKEKQMSENNSGLIRYGFPYPGLDPILKQIFIKYGVKFVRSSDAHVYSDIGRVFDQIDENI